VTAAPGSRADATAATSRRVDGEPGTTRATEETGTSAESYLPDEGFDLFMHGRRANRRVNRPHPFALMCLHLRLFAAKSFLFRPNATGGRSGAQARGSGRLALTAGHDSDSDPDPDGASPTNGASCAGY
jgi:hypothetical protein